MLNILLIKEALWQTHQIQLPFHIQRKHEMKTKLPGYKSQWFSIPLTCMSNSVVILKSWRATQCNLHGRHWYIWTQEKQEKIVLIISRMSEQRVKLFETQGLPVGQILLIEMCNSSVSKIKYCQQGSTPSRFHNDASTMMAHRQTSTWTIRAWKPLENSYNTERIRNSG